MCEEKDSQEKEILSIKKKLIKRRGELLDKISSSKEKERNISEVDRGDDIDRATTSENREMVFIMGSREREELKNIEEALRRIDSGTYGICNECEKKISKKRLEILPFTHYCRDCQSKIESSSK
ncbi:MAG: TraR/DksA family transcriptional regulator [Nitrospinae bacterium]|nr:TraR/DksA family transcriptional regulator [Nitrospinota bacterium]